MRERYGNPVIGDSVNLQLFVMNANANADVDVQKIEIYKLDDLPKTDDNPDGKRLVLTVDASDVVHNDTGEYSTEVLLESPLFTLGKYSDIWFLEFNDGEAPAQQVNYFDIKRDLWYTDVAPIVHDFKFTFSPNRIIKGSKKYISIKVDPIVPRGTDLERYYKNLITISTIYVSLEMKCGNCMPSEQDLRMIFEDEPINYKDGCFAYFFLDTTDLGCGVYNIQFSMEMGNNQFVSDKQQLLIYD